MQKATETARPTSEALCENYEKVARVIDGVGGFVRDHLILCALIALGILILLSTWVIEASGFAEGSIVRGERRACFHAVTMLHRYADAQARFAAAVWQSTYADSCSNDLFSFCRKGLG